MEILDLVNPGPGIRDGKNQFPDLQHYHKHQMLLIFRHVDCTLVYPQSKQKQDIQARSCPDVPDNNSPIRYHTVLD
jgi:hypothetical protein